MEVIYLSPGELVPYAKNAKQHPPENEKKLHVTMKPVEVISWAMDTSKEKANAVVDLFGGSGTTLIACEQTGRKCYMMELDPHYIDVIIQRWENLTGQKAELIRGDG